MKYIILSSLLSFFILGACGFQTDLKQQTAKHIARPAFLVERTIPTGSFELQAWERMHQRGTSATIYIEGDSKAIALTPDTDKVNFREFWGVDATRDNPVGLHLASRDLSENLAYLARPCQNVKFPEKHGCDPKYWGEDRFAPEVLEAYDVALNDIAARWNITDFHLVGFGGGANIAGVLAARRSDVSTLRTVAGDLNPRFVDNEHSVSVSSNAVLAIDFGATLAKVPQHHFVGAADEIVTPGTYHSYRQAIGLSDCIHYSLIQDADHTNGWVEKWPQLRTVEPQCATIHDLDGDLPDLKDFPGNYHKGKSFKK